MYWNIDCSMWPQDKPKCGNRGKQFSKSLEFYVFIIIVKYYFLMDFPNVPGSLSTLHGSTALCPCPWTGMLTVYIALIFISGHPHRPWSPNSRYASYSPLKPHCPAQCQAYSRCSAKTNKNTFLENVCLRSNDLLSGLQDMQLFLRA